MGFYNTNMILAKLGENPIGPEGDVFWSPVNMQNAARMLDTESTLDQPIGTDPAGADPAVPPTSAQRSLFAPYLSAMTGLFSDAVGRVTTRSKRDATSLSPILRPVLVAIASIVVTEARSQFRLGDDWQPSGKVAHEYVKGLAARAVEWTPETRDQITETELLKAIRSIHIGIFREAGAAVALKDSPNE